MGPVAGPEAEVRNAVSKILKKSVPLPVVLTIALLASTGVIAAWFYSHEISTSITIIATYGMGVWKTMDPDVVLESIAFGDFFRGAMKVFPGEEVTDQYYIENTGEAPIYVHFAVLNPTTGVMINLMVDPEHDGTYANVFDDRFIQGPIPAGGVVYFRVKVTVNGVAAFGSSSPTLQLSAQDTAPP